MSEKRYEDTETTNELRSMIEEDVRSCVNSITDSFLRSALFYLKSLKDEPYRIETPYSASLDALNRLGLVRTRPLYDKENPIWEVYPTDKGAEYIQRLRTEGFFAEEKQRTQEVGSE